jgi:signal transduction histidine kinase/CheY-like chemotaxis protein
LWNKALFLLLLLACPLQAWARPDILVLHSYHPGLSWTDDIHAGILETLGQSPMACTVTTEYLDAKRYPGPDLLALQSESVAAHVRTTDFDVVIVSDDAAFTFAMDRRRELFADVPIVFCGVNNFREEMRRGEPRVTGVSEIISVQETLDTALAFHPETTDVVIIGGNITSTDRSNRSQFLRLMPAYAERVRFHFWQNIPTARLQEKLGNLGPGNIVFLTQAQPGTDGRMLDFGPSAALVRNSTSRPVYGLWDFFLGHGIVGGKLINGKAQGKLAAAMALRILSGTDPDEIPVVEGLANRFLFDHNELVRFQISRTALPPESTVINRPQSLFEANRRLFTIFTVIVAGLLAVILFLAAVVHIRRQTLKELRRARQKAEEASQAKSLFLAHMSHEIRTPLTGIMGLAELALTNPTAPGVKDYLVLIRQSGQNLLQIINDILDFSKVEAGKLELNPSDFSVRRMLEATVSLFEPRAMEKGITLSLAMNAEPPDLLHGDELRLRQILYNLVGNAIKFTEKGGVEVRLAAAVKTPSGTTLTIEVRDTGCGIPADRLPAIFDRFTQADSFPTRSHQGTGLGLAIVRQLVEAMGGAIEVHSTVDSGSTFTISLPLEGAKLNAEPGTADAGTRDTGRPLSVLVAEDNPVNQLFLRRTLEKLGHIPTCVPDGSQALDALRAAAFDCVLMDIQMPRMDGSEATRRIRQDLGLAVPVIALTAHAMQGDREKYLTQGFDDYLAKPVTIKELERVLGSVQKKGD